MDVTLFGKVEYFPYFTKFVKVYLRILGYLNVDRCKNIYYFAVKIQEEV